MAHFFENLAGGPTRVPERLYSELRRTAAACLRRERPDHTLCPTDLVHEACLRLRTTGADDALSDAELRALAARTMRRVLVDHARRRAAAKRDAGRRSALDENLEAAAARDAYVVALDDALADLAAFDAQLVAVVELLFFGGCTTEEAAQTLGVSPRTIKRRWSLAKGWLHREITRDGSR